MNILNYLFNTKEKLEIDNPAKAILQAIAVWKNRLPEMLLRDATANNCSTIDDFITLLAINGEGDNYTAKVHKELLKDLISEPVVTEAIVEVKNLIIDRLKIVDLETKSYVHDLIFRRIVSLGDFKISLPPLENYYGNRIGQKKEAEIFEMVQLVLGLPGFGEKYPSKK